MTISKSSGLSTVTTVRVWNETVSNLTLMALGSSAPEILLSVIEVWRLTPMVGSFVFNVNEKPIQTLICLKHFACSIDIISRCFIKH